MKNIIALIIFASFFIGCTKDMTNVFSPPDEYEPTHNTRSQCKASCVISDLQIWDEILPHEEAKMIFGTIGDTLRVYLYRLEDGREGSLEKSEFDTLSLGDILPRCNTDEAVGACPNYGGN